MKPKNTLRSFLAIAVAGSSLLAISPVHAATLTWDHNADGTASDGGGPWLNASQGLDGGSPATWNNGTPDNAIIGSYAGPNTYTGATTVSAGTLTLSGADGSIRSSAVTVAGGTLTLSNTGAANHGDRLSDSLAFTMNGGTFNSNNDASANDFSESAGTLTLVGGANTVGIQQAAVGQTSTLTFAGLSRTAGAINFTGAGLGTAVDPRGKITFTSGETLRVNSINSVPTAGALTLGTAVDTGTLGPVTFDGDTNGDGVQDGMAFLLGVANPDDANGNLPTITEDGSGNLVMQFDCLPGSARGTAELRVAHSNNLGSWTATADVVPDANDPTPDNHVTFVVGAGPAGPPALNKVTATIGSAAAAGGKLFGRLEATE